MPPDQYRVAASCFEPQPDHDMARRRVALRSHLVQLIECHRPDLVVLPELAVAWEVGGDSCLGAEPLAGPSVSMVMELAASFKVNICVPIMEDDRGSLFNTAVYVDRTGQIAGSYRKQVPTMGELRQGIQPGRPDQPPTTLDGFRIGTAICFDGNYPDQIWHWIAEGIDLLVFPAYTFAGELMQSWAAHCGVPLICAFPWESVIYDRDGATLAKAGTLTTTVRFGHHPHWIAATLNMQSRIYHLDNNQLHLKRLAERFGAKVDVRLMERDGRMMLTSRSADASLEVIERELGLTPLQSYLRDSRTKAAHARQAGIAD